jgi:hypothetical protein
MWHLRRVVPRPEVLLFTTKKASLVNQADIMGTFKKASYYKPFIDMKIR